MEENDNRGFRGCLTLGFAAIVLVALMIFLMSIGGEKDTPTTAEGHIYDNAEIVTLMSGSGTEEVGKCSVVKAAYDDVTDAALADWYFNHVEPGEYNYAVIIYTDKSNTGVYGNKGIVEKDVGLLPEKDGSYSMGSDENAVIYYASGGKLVALEDGTDEDPTASISVDECIQKLDAALKENFKDLGENAYKLTTEGTVTTISVSTDGIAQIAVLAAAGDAESIAAWDDVVNGMKALSVNSQEFFNDFGHSECSTLVQVVNDLDSTRVLLAVSHEVVLFDAVNGINLLGVSE